MPMRIAYTAPGHPLQPPSRRTRTTPSSSTASTSMFAPSIWSAGAISSAMMCWMRCFRLVQSSISAMTCLPALRRRNAARLFDVDLQLLDQLRRAAKRPRVAQALEEIDGQRCPVEVAVEADQVSLHLTRVFTEGG